MEEMSLGVLIAVFEEMFGRWLWWAMVVVAVVITLLWVYVLIRDRKVSWRKYLLAQLSMPIGAVAAVWFVMARTGSGLHHMGGPLDWLAILGIAVAGAVGFAILVYVVQSLIWPPQRPSASQQG